LCTNLTPPSRETKFVVSVFPAGKSQNVRGIFWTVIVSQSTAGVTNVVPAGTRSPARTM